MFRKQHILKFALFLTPLMALLFIYEAGLYTIPTSYSKKYNYLNSQLSSINGLILGDSHGVYNYAPGSFPLKVFNLANISQSLQIDEKLLNSYIDKLPNLCFVIINLSYFSFEYQLTGNVDESRNFFYWRHYGFWGDSQWLDRLKLSYWSQLIIFDPEIARDYIFEGFNKDLGVEITPLGGFDTSKSKIKHPAINDTTGLARAQYHTSTMKPSLRNTNIATLQRMIKRLKSNNITPILIQSPAYKSYYSHLNSEKLAAFNKTVQSFRVPWFDYLRHPSFVKNDFINNDHLNFDGAKKFSILLANELNLKEKYSCK